LTAIHETAYPRIRSNITEKELNNIYTPQEEDLKFVRKHTYTSVSQLGLLVFLKVFKRLGYFPTTDEIPKKVIRHIAVKSGLKRFASEINKYDKSGSRWKHQGLIRSHQAITAYSDGGETVMKKAMVNAAYTKDILADIINVSIEDLVRYKYELPGFTVLLKAARQTRNDINTLFYTQIFKWPQLEKT